MHARVELLEFRRAPTASCLLVLNGGVGALKKKNACAWNREGPCLGRACEDK
jgi:hypothetical protein